VIVMSRLIAEKLPCLDTREGQQPETEKLPYCIQGNYYKRDIYLKRNKVKLRKKIHCKSVSE
jgi:hypothetical protein